MDVKTQKKLDHLEETKHLIREAIEEKGQTVTDSDSFRSYADKIANIETGADVSAVTATAPHVLAGDVFVDAQGNPVEGTMPNRGNVRKQLDTAQASFALSAGYYTGGNVYLLNDIKDATPTKEEQIIRPDSGRVLSQVTVAPIPDQYQDVTPVTATAEDVRAGKVIVDAQGNEVVGTLVPGGGGGSLPVGAYWEALSIPLPATTGSRLFDFNGETYAFVSDEAATSADRYAVYKFANDSWTQIVDFLYMDCQPAIFRYVEYNGKLHICGGFDQKTHHIFDGTNLTRLTQLPYKASGQCSFVQDGSLKYFGYDGKVYVWDEGTDTWTVEATISPYNNYSDFFTINGTVYVVCISRVYIYENKALTTIYSGSYKPSMSFGAGVAIGDFIYGYYAPSTKNNPELWRYNTKTNIFEKVCNMPGANQSTIILIKYKDTLVLNPYFSDQYTSWMALHEVTE